MTEARTGREDKAEEGSQRLVLPLIIAATTLAALALSLTWLNLERTKLAYQVRTLQHGLEQALDLNAKLSVERDHLLSPHELGKRAEQMGLGPAKPGQIRRMDGSGEAGAAETDTMTEE